jgi:hypothetical protein
MKELKIPTTKPELKKLILEALRLGYTSTGKDNIATGNHYQSLNLGGERTDGFRGDRDVFLDQIDFKGKRVLDLGSNLGEISRAARNRGARLVDGLEYDPFFVEVAQLLNAYDGTSGVSFYERDITDPDVYQDRYDLVLAFSVFTYIHPILKRLAEITDEALVVETHKLDGNLQKGYIDPVRKFLPVHKVLGESDWGRALPESQKRAVIVFARDQASLERALGERPPARPRRVIVDVQRTRLQRVFLDATEGLDGATILDQARRLEIDLDRLAHEDDLAKAVYSGRAYWEIFLKGYAQYLESNSLGPSNVYYDYIVNYYAPRGHDPGVADALRDPLFALHRIASRFRDLDQFRVAPRTYVPAPVRLFQTGDRAADRLLLYEPRSDEPIRASRVDGWHRLFAAHIFGATNVPGEVVESAGA